MKTLAAFLNGSGAAKKYWNSPWVGVPLWLIVAALACFWLFNVPPPGYSVGFLAVVAGIMSVRDMKTLGKIMWVVLLVCLLVTEFQAIGKDRAENERKQKEFFEAQRLGFQEVASQANRNFDVTAKRLETVIANDREQFGSTMNGISREIKTYTGGESYTYLTYVPNQGFLEFIHKGDYPLFSVVARITDLDDPRHDLIGTIMQLGDLIKGHASSRNVPASIAASELTRDTINFNIFFTARNGDWVELLRARRDHEGKWTRALIVEGAFSSMKRSSIMCETIDNGFPIETLDKGFEELSADATEPPPCR